MAARRTQVVLQLCRLLTIFTVINVAIGQVLTPPYFNLAVQRQVTASSTCGYGVSEPELFCKLTGANRGANDGSYVMEDDFEVIQGQLCDYCHRADEDPGKYKHQKDHSARHATDGTEQWWQSPPLSRDIEYNQVNLTIDLGQEFHVAYVFIKMANSPRPGVFALERTTDYGRTWKPWQYFADTPSDCNSFFGDAGYETQITSDNSVVCTTAFSSIVPLEGGEIVVSLVNDRPSSTNFSYSSTLQEWTKATGIRLRLLRTKTLLGHLMAKARQDPTVTRRYYYSIKDISIGGRCVCNGHADTCDVTDPDDASKLKCRCHHNTCGDQCESCCPGHIQKPWQPATLGDVNECEECNCHGHSDTCVYDEDVAAERRSLDIHGNYEGGGVCQGCRDHTTGVNCEICEDGYYRPYSKNPRDRDACQQCRCDPMVSTGKCEDGTGRCECRLEYAGSNCDRCNVGFFDYPRCLPCQCNPDGTLNQVCEVGGGQCPCKANYDGANCDRCAYGYYNFPECTPCNCDAFGASSPNSCSQHDGQCSCRSNFQGRDCGECSNGYYNYPSCNMCNCDQTGSTDEICDRDTGYCLCDQHFGGSTCEQCADGFYRYPRCIECGCNEMGSQGTSCDDYGQCICQMNFAGQLCDRCAPGYYKYPECLACECDTYGSYGQTCDQQTGQCTCRHTFEGLQCADCKPNFYNYPLCEECSCNPSGAKQVPGYPLGGCGRYNDGRLCECKERVAGRICDSCNPGYWNLDINNPLGCESCNCYEAGTIGSSPVCAVDGGQCECKPYVEGRQCNQCVDGTYNLDGNNVFGCQACGCDVGGSRDNTCNKDTGDCNCHPRITGRRCDQPLSQHYVPTLFQMQYEMEDGRTVRGGEVRYGFDQDVFPDYSWRGYAIYSRIQDEVLVDVDISKASLYRIIFHYHNPGYDNINADVTVTPESSTEATQSGNIILPPTNRPKHESVLNQFVLNSGRWTISLKTPERIYVDYVVLLPQVYYEATILQEKVDNPCTVPLNNDLCKHYAYIEMTPFPSVRGENGYIRVGSDRERVPLYPDTGVCEDLGIPNMAHLNPQIRSFFINLPLPGPGKYVLIIQYHSQVDRRQDLNIDVASPGGRDQGTAFFNYCPYSSLCRQAVLDENSEVKVFDIDGNYASLTLSGGADIDLAIDSVTAIPVAEWSIDYIQPNFQCVRKDKVCIEATYAKPPGSLQIEFEVGNEDRIATDLPPLITDINVKAIKLGGSAPSIVIRSSVSHPGNYVLVTHYYQPNNVGFDVKIKLTVDNKEYNGYFTADYCPIGAGCRSTVTFPDLPSRYVVELTDMQFTITVNNTNLDKPIWLDYIQVIPASQFVREDYTKVQDIDKSAEFIEKCGEDNFFIDMTEDGFCRDAVFSLTTDNNSGAQTCDCNLEGSLSFRCDEFGGQCRCKNYVIGRTCSQCQTGYYGFPNCRECTCPSKLCDSITGQCVCPPKVTGNDCNICLPQTFGFDPLIGCEECNCEGAGVINNNLDCDADNGKCSCKSHVSGRRCDVCEAGYYSYPRCMPCSCDTRGTGGDVCDQRSAECLCKDNVQGQQCSECKPSTFYLEDRNPLGCAQCFCFGFTSRCQSSTLRRTAVVDMRGWAITNLKMPEVYQRGQTIEALVQSEDIIYPRQPIYWVAPATYLGNKVTSYGGQLRYTVKFLLPLNEESTGLVDTDVRLEGNNYTLVHIAVEQPVNGIPLEQRIDLLETQFIHESSGALVTREQLMVALSQVVSLQIRASYYSIVRQVTLTDVSMDVATDDGTGGLARNVEQCECPPNYRGTSCEECADGFYRAKTGPYLGSCVPCQCNNKASSCDPNTGECLNCRDNFGGPQCLACMPGHFHDPLSNTCGRCACPMAIPSNNFASTCNVRSDGVVTACNCLTGYVGRHCERCDFGYWGNPEEIGSQCRPCDCSGNIDIYDPQSCDLLTGECVRCQNNTAGDRCERCRDWYFGDAIDLKDCKTCDCDETGSEMCDHRTGACLCKSNVVGRRCSQCAPGTFGFDSANGCQMCDCARAAFSTDCDAGTGQCDCREGVTGRRCDRCEQGYWNYQSGGCVKCNCEFEGAVTCDAVTGRCECLPGVTGPNCDMCLPRWVMIPRQGCQECDSCIHLLLDEVEYMDHNITEMIIELETVSVGVTTMRRLQKINETVHELRPMVDSIVDDPSDPGVLDDLVKEVEELQRKSESISDEADRTVRTSEVAEANAADSKVDAVELREYVRMGVEAANDAVDFAVEVLDNIRNNNENKNLDELLREAREILDVIQGRDFTDNKKSAEDELEQAEDLLERVKNLKRLIMEQEERIQDSQTRLDDLTDKLRELFNFSRHSIDNSQAAKIINMNSRELMAAIKDKIARITAGEKVARDILSMANDTLDLARQYLRDARVAYAIIERELTRLDNAMVGVNERLEYLTEQNKELRPLVDNATEHAYKLKAQADFLESISDIGMSGDNALKIIAAYKAIVKAIDEAYNASQEAVDKAMEAVVLTDGLAEQARLAFERSMELNLQAETVNRTVENVLLPRSKNAMDYTDNVIELQEIVNTELEELINGLDSLHDGFTEEAEDAAERAEEARQKAENASSRIEDIVNKLPKDRTTVIELDTVIRTANIDITTSLNQVADVRNIIPEADRLLTSLNVTAERVMTLGLRVQGDLTELRNKISVARVQANLIKVGMKFEEHTTLQVRNPQDIQLAGSYNELSMYFKTDQPNGFLGYIGPDVRSVQSETDYMSVQVVDGFVVFTYDLGFGPTIVTNPRRVDDNKWHQVIVERTGKSATLTVRSPDEPKSVVANGSAEGSYAVFDLNSNPYNTRFFVGGVPSVAGLRDRLQYLRFQGSIEDVKFDQVPVGLWNFVYGEHLAGAYARDALIGVDTNGFKFDGDGYLILDKKNYNTKDYAKVLFDFKTFAEDGLMFLMASAEGETDFFAVDMVGGKIKLSYNLGSGIGKVLSEETFNDGQWHTVSAERYRKQGLLKVDDQTIGAMSSGGVHKHLETNNQLFIGGFRGTHSYRDVSNMGFEGCIQNFYLGPNLKNMNDNLEAKGIQPGCPQIARVVSFSSDVPNSYIAMDPVSVERDYEMTFKVKTEEKDGLLFYATDDTTDQNNAFSVSVLDGKVSVTAAAEDRRTTLETNNANYNDGNWHYITVTKTGKELQLHIDDSEMVTTSIDGKRRIKTTTPLYFGGVPPGYSIVSSNVGTEVNFLGCIGDVTVNGHFMNFAIAPLTSQKGVILNHCSVEDPPTPAPPVVPFPPIVFTTEVPAKDIDCALPADPEAPGPNAVASGNRFGLHVNSRFEYSNFEEDIKTASQFSVDFRTTYKDGVLFYVDDERHVDFMALYMKGGRLTFSFNSGTGAAVITSDNFYNTGDWYTVTFTREETSGQLLINGGDEDLRGVSQGTSTSLDVTTPFFLGGMDLAASTLASDNTNRVNNSFVGCLKNFMQYGAPLSAQPQAVDTRPCYSNVESGAFFYADGGYLLQQENFDVGLDLNLSIKVRPRSAQGILMSVHNKEGDYMVMQLVNGELRFAVENGGGEIEAIHKSPFASGLCDGQWHTIEAIKAKNLVRLNVDGVFVADVTGTEGVSSTDTSDPIYIGGVPERHKGIKSPGQYVGCIKDLVINGIPHSMAEAMVSGKVDLNFCPQN